MTMLDTTGQLLLPLIELQSTLYVLFVQTLTRLRMPGTFSSHAFGRVLQEVSSGVRHTKNANP